MVVGVPVLLEWRLPQLFRRMLDGVRLRLLSTECLANKSIQNVRLDRMRHRILLSITRHVDDNDRYYERNAQQIECVAVERNWKGGERKFY